MGRRNRTMRNNISRRVRFRPNKVGRNRNGRRVEFTGTRVMGPANPRTTQDVPWNQVVIQRSVSVADNTAFTVPLTYVRDIIADQLDQTPDASITFRVLGLNLYDMAGRPVEMAIYDYRSSLTAVNSQLLTSISWPGRVSWPRVGYTWPLSISDQPFSFSGAAANTVARGAVGSPLGVVDTTTTVLLLRFHVLWRPTQSQTVPTHVLVAHVTEPSSTSKTMKSVMTPDSAIPIPSEANNQMDALGIRMQL